MACKEDCHLAVASAVSAPAMVERARSGSLQDDGLMKTVDPFYDTNVVQYPPIRLRRIAPRRF